MTTAALKGLAVGDALAPWAAPRIDRTMLALFAGGSGDLNPLHIDIDFARDEAGMPDVIGHGMLTMAFLGRYVGSFAEQTQLRGFGVRFLDMARPGDAIVCEGRIEALDTEQGEHRVRLAIVARRGEQALASGHAVIATGEAGSA